MSLNHSEVGERRVGPKTEVLTVITPAHTEFVSGLQLESSSMDESIKGIAGPVQAIRVGVTTGEEIKKERE